MHYKERGTTGEPRADWGTSVFASISSHIAISAAMSLIVTGRCILHKPSYTTILLHKPPWSEGRVFLSSFIITQPQEYVTTVYCVFPLISDGSARESHVHESP